MGQFGIGQSVKRFEDVQPFMRMMPFDAGFRSIGVPYRWQPRKRGVSRNRFWQLVDQGLNGFTGFGIALLSFFYAFALFVLKLLRFDLGAQGITTIVIAIFFFGGVQMLFLGLLGEYIVAIFNQVRRRPIVIERERINFDKAN